jgi:hypothetical protein
VLTSSSSSLPRSMPCLFATPWYATNTPPTGHRSRSPQSVLFCCAHSSSPHLRRACGGTISSWCSVPTCPSTRHFSTSGYYYHSPRSSASKALARLLSLPFPPPPATESAGYAVRSARQARCVGHQGGFHFSSCRHPRHSVDSPGLRSVRYNSPPSPRTFSQAAVGAD